MHNVEEEGGMGICPNLSQSVCTGMGGVACWLTSWLAGWLAGWVGGWVWGGPSCHLCYDLHGCQSQRQKGKALAGLEGTLLLKAPFIAPAYCV